MMVTQSAQRALSGTPNGRYRERPMGTIGNAHWALLGTPNGHYWERPLGTIGNAHWALLGTPNGHYWERPMGTVGNAQWALLGTPNRGETLQQQRIPAGNYILHKFQFVLNFATKATTDEKTKKFQQSSNPKSSKWAA
jgi:hypothetical protein